MSKSVVRVVLSVLIALGIIAAVYTSVMGASSNAGVIRGQAHLTAGLMPDLGHQREAVQKLQNYMPQTKPGHQCEDEAYNQSDD